MSDRVCCGSLISQSLWQTAGLEFTDFVFRQTTGNSHKQVVAWDLISILSVVAAAWGSSKRPKSFDKGCWLTKTSGANDGQDGATYQMHSLKVAGAETECAHARNGDCQTDKANCFFQPRLSLQPTPGLGIGLCGSVPPSVVACSAGAMVSSVPTPRPSPPSAPALLLPFLLALLLSSRPQPALSHAHYPGERAPLGFRAELRANMSSRGAAGPGCTLSGRRVGVVTFNDRRSDVHMELATMMNALYTQVRVRTLGRLP